MGRAPSKVFTRKPRKLMVNVACKLARYRIGKITGWDGHKK